MFLNLLYSLVLFSHPLQVPKCIYSLSVDCILLFNPHSSLKFIVVICCRQTLLPALLSESGRKFVSFVIVCLIYHVVFVFF